VPFASLRSTRGARPVQSRGHCGTHGLRAARRAIGDVAPRSLEAPVLNVGAHLRVLRAKGAVARCRGLDDPRRLANAMRHLGEAYGYAANPALAERWCLEALSMIRRLGTGASLDLANALRAVAVARDDLGARDAARPMWREARDLYRALGVAEGVAECDARLAKDADGDGGTESPPRL